MSWLRTPYGAWLTMRLVWIASLIGLPVFGIAFIVSGPGNGWMLAVLAVCGVLVQGESYWKTSRKGGARIAGDRVGFFLDQIGKRLSPHQCSQCGQSCFDDSPASGYAPETAKRGFWPNSVCTNCGADLTKREAS